MFTALKRQGFDGDRRRLEEVDVHRRRRLHDGSEIEYLLLVFEEFHVMMSGES